MYELKKKKVLHKFSMLSPSHILFANDDFFFNSFFLFAEHMFSLLDSFLFTQTVEKLNTNLGDEVRMVMEQMNQLLEENNQLRMRNEVTTDKFREDAKRFTWVNHCVRIIEELLASG